MNYRSMTCISWVGVWFYLISDNFLWLLIVNTTRILSSFSTISRFLDWMLLFLLMSRCVSGCVCALDFHSSGNQWVLLSDGTISNPKHAKLHCQIEIVTDSTDNISRSFLLVSKLTIYWFVCFYIKRKERKFVLFTYLILVWGYFVGCRWSTSPTTCGTFDFFGYSKFYIFPFSSTSTDSVM